MIKHLGGRKLALTSSHRRAMLRNLAVSLILHERLETTMAKAKELRPFAEKIITQARRGNHVLVRKDIQHKVAYKKLFEVVIQRYQNRPGGYVQIMRLGPRPGDNAPLGLIRLVP